MKLNILDPALADHYGKPHWFVTKSGNRFQDVARYNYDKMRWEWQYIHVAKLCELARRFPDEKVMLEQISGMRSYSRAMLKNLYIEVW
jgi:hypothetical protein